MQSYSHYNTLRYLQAKALINTLVVAVEEAKSKDLAAPRVMGRPRLETLGDLIKAVKAHALADTMADAVPAAKT